MSKPWILVSPASRGIGNALTRHLLRTTNLPILATARSPDTAAVKASIVDSLQGNINREDLAPRLHVTQLDVTSESSVSAAAERAEALFPRDTHHLHLGFALPGVLLNPEKKPSDIHYDDALETMRVNVLGPLMLMKCFSEFLPRKATALEPQPPPSPEDEERQQQEGAGFAGPPLRLPDHATWLAMSARVGSTTDNRLGGWYAYRASKAAVTSLARTLDNQLRTRSGEQALALAYHPGTVKTNLSRDFWATVKPEKLFTPEYAAERIVEVVRTRSLEDRGRFWDWKGEEILP